MSKKIPSLIKPQELLLLKQTKQIALIDARAGVGSKEKYLAKHLNGALHIDLETQLSEKNGNAANGGRHPLPHPLQFCKTLKQLGIDSDAHVIIYDDKSGSNAAARFWWMLRSIGHEKVQVLDGGFDAAVAAGFLVSSNEETPQTRNDYKIEKWQLPLADINQVEEAIDNNNYLIIDVRDTERFRGEKEPIDLIAGHIPNAINIPFTSNLDENGFYLSPSELKNKYLQAFDTKKTENIIVHCGSGVTACHTLLAIDYAGLEIPKLYVGSWSEWSRNNKPIATETKTKSS